MKIVEAKNGFLIQIAIYLAKDTSFLPYAYRQTERFSAKNVYFSKMLEDSSFQLHSMISYDVHAEALTDLRLVITNAV